jgi:hypothetical protein
MKVYAFSDISFISRVSADSVGRCEHGVCFFFKMGRSIGSGF